jgi:DNA segregation ATPase FtsK/SpoIIIE, S-DNA-T family
MSRRRYARKPFKLGFSLDPKMRKGIFTVFVLVGAILSALAIFGLAGSFGAAVDGMLTQVFGWDKLFVPIFLAAWGYHLIDEEKLRLKATNFIGFILFFVGLNGLVHAVTFPNPADAVDPETLKIAAGKLGQLLAEPAIRLLGFAGATVVFIGLFLVSVIFIFNTSMKTIVGIFVAIWRGIVVVARFVWRLVAVPVVLLARLKANRTSNAEETAMMPEPVEDLDLPIDEEAVEEGVPSSGVPSVTANGRSVQAALPLPKPKKRRPKVTVPVDLLQRRDERPTAGDIEFNKEVIRKTLKHFGIDVEMGDVAVGPTVTQFTFKPGEGVKLVRITALHNDLALALAAHPIRLEAPIPGKSLVGVEVPNKSVALVGLREMLESRSYREKEQRMAIPFALGRDVSGMPMLVDLSRMPHMLVAGATGAGKSVCLNILISCLLYGHGPDDLKLILVDPKRVEFPIYNGVPHLLTPVITKVEDTVNALKWTVREMDRRFDVLSAFGARDIASYNERSKERMPYLVFIVDELADLMVMSGPEVEGPIVRLAQMARAVGIHLVLATQRPSVDVLTGLIKANIPARFAFSVASATDSRTILDRSGAEKLLGRGDMLYQTAEMAAPKRVQGAFITDNEVRRVVDFLKASYGPPEFESAVTESSRSATAFGNGGGNDEDSDPLLEAAMEEIIRAGKASASLLQRRLKVGYARAARILDLLEREGMIGPGEGAKPREILQTEFPGAERTAVPAVAIRPGYAPIEDRPRPPHLDRADDIERDDVYDETTDLDEPVEALTGSERPDDDPPV